MSHTNALYTGNDASKTTLDIDAYPQINTVSTAAQFSNDDTGCKQLTALLADFQPKLIVMEATGS